MIGLTRLLPALSSVLLLPPALAAPTAQDIDFSRDVRPILSDNCFHCHGPDPATRMAGLRLDTREGATAALKSGGHAVAPGDVDESELLYRIAPLFEEEVMPPASSGKALTQEQVDVLQRWVAGGAAWDDHWSFKVPTLDATTNDQGDTDSGPMGTSIDAFVAAELGQHALLFQEEAAPLALLRRANLDLVGLPPTAEERRMFMEGIRTVGLNRAFAAAVDRCLASPRYGVHMARTWLDAARYADTHGLHLDNHRNMWPYRDWVVNALNGNMPFDQFTIEQLAGDLLENPTPTQLIASGFNRCNPTSAEGGMITEEYLSIYAKDRTDTTATVWLGLTLSCAQCHDHKFDPLSQRDYYGMYAFFNSIDEEATDRNVENPKPFVRALNAVAEAKLDGLQARSTGIEHVLNVSNPQLDDAASAWIAEQQAEHLAQWTNVVPTRATSTGGAKLVIAPVTSEGTSETTWEVTAKGDNPATPVYEVDFEVASGAIDGLRLDAIPMPGETIPGRAPNNNFFLSFLEVEHAPLDGSGPFQPVALRSAFATHSQEGYPVAGVLDPDVNTGWAGLGLDGPRSAMVQPTIAFGHPSGTLVRVRMHFSDIHLRHAFARFRLGVRACSDRGAAPGMGVWWHAHFEAERPSGLYKRKFISEAAIAAGLDVLEEAAPGVAWIPEPGFVPDRLHALDTGLGVHYLVLRLFASEERTYQLRLGSDDGLEVWLRGTKLFSNREARNVALDQDIVPITLVPGQNELLVKIVNAGGAGGFAWRLWDADGEDELAPDQVLALTMSDESKSSSSDPLGILARRQLDAAWSAEYERLEEVNVEIATFQEQLPSTLVSGERAERRQARIQIRGAYDRLGDNVEPATPAVLPPLLTGEGPANRLTLARWLVDGNNPLTARVWVNRAWQHFFGQGIVTTPEDFGSQGAWPSHPEMLDWLAVTFVDEGWDMKAMHRRIVLSKAYRQSSTQDPDRVAMDPTGALLSHGPRFRLDGEVLRDQALYLAGLLDETMGGPGVRPYQPDGVWFAVGYTGSNTVRYEVGPESHQRRRSLYTYWKRTAPPPNLTTFDAPMRESCAVQRERTNTPLQALVTLNDPTYVESAKFMAARFLGENQVTIEERAAALFEHIIGRPPTVSEATAIIDLATELTNHYRTTPDSAEALLATGMLPFMVAPSELDTAALAAWTLVASTLLNLDEALTNG